jgi:glycosyltransferase involved in cell wall biosynthesis
MNIIYITNLRLPTEKTYAINIIKTCQAFSDLGVKVVLVAPHFRDQSRPDVFAYYGVRKNFVIHLVPFINAVSLVSRLDIWMQKHIAPLVGLVIPTLFTIGFWVNNISFAIAAQLTKPLRQKGDVVVFTRDALSGWLLRLRDFCVVYDMHGFPLHKMLLWKRAMKKMSGIVVTNYWKREQCVKVFGIPERKIVVAPNGFDPKLFVLEGNRQKLRQALGLQVDKRIVVYTGHLYDWKGAHVLASTAPLMPDAQFIFIGGSDDDRISFNKRFGRFSNVIVIGRCPHYEIPKYLKAADVVVLPGSRISSSKRLATFSIFDTSPIKLFEYMASGTPIVATDLPSTREILNDENAVVVEPDNPQALKKGIESVLTDKNLASKISRRARIDAEKYTWPRRAEWILEFIARVC